MENYLTFTVDEHLYAINVNSVLEVLNLSVPTAIPCALPYVEGLIYSRGQGITVVNLRKRFGLKDHAPDKRTKIIVVEMKIKNDTSESVILYGLVADSVQDVIQTYDEEHLENEKCSIPQEFIEYAFLWNESPLFILNFEKLFEEHARLTQTQPELTKNHAEEKI